MKKALEAWKHYWNFPTIAHTNIIQQDYSKTGYTKLQDEHLEELQSISREI